MMGGQRTEGHLDHHHTGGRCWGGPLEVGHQGPPEGSLVVAHQTEGNLAGPEGGPQGIQQGGLQGVR